MQAVGIQEWGPTAHGGSIHTTGVDLALLYVDKSIVPSSAQPHCVFLGDSNTKMQWAEVFELVFPVVGTVVIFAVLPVGGIGN